MSLPDTVASNSATGSSTAFVGQGSSGAVSWCGTPAKAPTSATSATEGTATAAGGASLSGTLALKPAAGSSAFIRTASERLAAVGPSVARGGASTAAAASATGGPSLARL